MLTIEHATKQHIPIIRDLTAQTWPHTYYPIVGEAQVAYMLALFYTPEALAAQMDSGHVFLIAMHTGTPVAFASFGLIEPQVYKLHKLYILPGRQGLGIGRALINHIVASIQAAEGNELRLNVNIHNHNAITFYGKAGFLHLRDEDIDIGNGYFMNDHVLTLPISG